MNKESLRQFLIDSNKAGYATGKEKQWIKEADGSTTIPTLPSQHSRFAPIEKGEWRSHDNFFGGEPYGGRVVVFYRGKAVWMMVYYGWVVEEVDVNLVYKILRSALMRMPEDAPFRGPKKYQEGAFIYRNSWKGDVEQFSGEEKIMQGRKIVYKASYMGGLVDQRKGV